MDIKIIDKIDKNPNWGLDAINIKKIWNYTKGEGVKIAIIDTGVGPHKDLEGKIKKTLNVFNRTTTKINDESGHGTLVAGIIAGEITGVAPNAELYIANVLNKDGLGTQWSVVEGLTFAINIGADIICFSLGTSTEPSPVLESRLLRAYENGILLVAATGNHGKQSVSYPAAYSYVVAVGGMDKELKWASFSNYGFETDVVAPAVDIISTIPENRYGSMSGTSVAAPFVAGAFALIKSYYRKQGIELTPQEMMDMLKLLNDKKDRWVGYGIMDVQKIIDKYNQLLYDKNRHQK